MKSIFIFLLIEVYFYEVHGLATLPEQFNTQNATLCGNLTCLHNAMCTADVCQCRMGYKGETCQFDLDECKVGDPCYHRGHCQNIFGSYRCDCLQGWKNGGSKHCEVQTHPDINFRKCMPGWMGDRCQDQCFTRAQCGQNQVCKKRGRGLRCLCVGGWQGTDCTTDVDECKNNPCKSFQECVNTVGSYTCTCPAGWKGSSCAEDIDECTGSSCNNSGTCTNADGSYSCSCTDGWKGTNCDEDVDECLKQPCNSSLTCQNIAGSFTCDVKPTLDKVDFGILKTNITLVAILGALLLLILTIIIVVVAKGKCRKSDEKDRESTPDIQIPVSKHGISVTGHTGSALYHEDKHGISTQHHTDTAMRKRDNHHASRKLQVVSAMYQHDNLDVSTLHPYDYAANQQNQKFEQRHSLDF